MNRFISIKLSLALSQFHLNWPCKEPPYNEVITPLSTTPSCRIATNFYLLLKPINTKYKICNREMTIVSNKKV